MSTKFSTIIENALYKFRDPDLALIFQEEADDVLLHYLKSSQVKFQKSCRFDLSNKDEILKEYKDDLGDEEIEILAIGVAYYWCSAQVLNGDLLKNSLSTSDWSQFSPANLLDKMTVLRDELRTELRNEIIDYSFNVNDISELKV